MGKGVQLVNSVAGWPGTSGVRQEVSQPLIPPTAAGIERQTGIGGLHIRPRSKDEARIPDVHQAIRAGSLTRDWLAPDIHFHDFNAVQRPPRYWNGSCDIRSSVERSIE